MQTNPVIDMAKTGENIVTLRKKAGLSIKEIQEAFGFGHHRRFINGSKGWHCPPLTIW